MNRLFEGLPDMLIYLAVGLGLLVVGTVLFSLITKMNEKKLILEKGNSAVALMLGGKVLGLAIVIWSAARYSVDLADFALWGGAGIVAQIVSYWIVEYLFFPKVSLAKKVEEGNTAPAIMLLVVSVAVGMIIAGCMSY